MGQHGHKGKWDKYESRIVKNNDNDYDYNPKNICQQYLTQYNKTTTIQYSKSSKYPSKLGRWFCRKGIGIQSNPRVIRHTICEGLYIDEISKTHIQRFKIIMSQKWT